MLFGRVELDYAFWKSGVLNGQGNSGVGVLNDAFRKCSFLNDAFLRKSGVLSLSDAFRVLNHAFRSCFLAYSLWTWIGGDVGCLFFTLLHAVRPNRRVVGDMVLAQLREEMR